MSEPSITCPNCGRTSYHPEDIKQKYCGACHAFHDEMKIGDTLTALMVKDKDGTRTIFALSTRVSVLPLPFVFAEKAAFDRSMVKAASTIRRLRSEGYVFEVCTYRFEKSEPLK